MRQKRYVIGTPYDMDQSKFSYLVEKCKGEDSIRGFAAKCKISKAIISNILNGVYKAPCSMHTIYAIYENRASGCEVTLDDLMTADGYVVEEEIIKPIYDIDPAFRGCARMESLEYLVQCLDRRRPQWRKVEGTQYHTMGLKYVVPYMEIEYPEEDNVYKRGIFSCPLPFSIGKVGGRGRKDHLEQGMDYYGTRIETVSSVLAKILLVIACNLRSDLPDGFTIVANSLGLDRTNYPTNVVVPHDITIVSISASREIEYEHRLTKTDGSLSRTLF